MTTPEPLPQGEDTATWSQEPEPPQVPSSPESATAPEPDDVADDELDPRTAAYVAKLKRECQQQRARARDAEEQLGAVSARVDVQTREQVAQAAAQAGLIDGNDLFLAHPDPNEFLDEQFRDVVEGKVRDATEKLLESKPYLGRTTGRPPTDRPLESLRPGASPEPKAPKTPSWSQALHGTGG